MCVHKQLFLLTQKPKVKIRHDSRTTKVCPHATVMAEFGDCNRGINISMLNQALGCGRSNHKIGRCTSDRRVESAWELKWATARRKLARTLGLM